MSQADSVIDSGPEVQATGELGADALYDKCMMLARNVWWSWHHEVINLFRDLDPIRWRQLDHNPIALLHEFTPERLASRAAEMVLYSRINYAVRRLKEYMTTQAAVGRDACRRAGGQARGVFLRRVRRCTNRCRFTPAAWGSCRATTSRAPAAWASRWWRSGCSTARAISASIWTSNGWQQEEYQDTRVENTAAGTRPRTRTASRSRCGSTRATGKLFAKVWLVQVGRVPLYLLDSNVEGNRPEDRELTSRLYGGDERTRIRQELLLGVGGVRALRALGITSGRLPSERRPQRFRAAGGSPRADAGRRVVVRRRACATSPSTRCSPRTRRCPPATTASTAA